jgi:hypothetical protein
MQDPARSPDVPLLCSLSRAASLLSITRYQLWLMAKQDPTVPILRVGPRKRLVDPWKLKLWLERKFAPAASVPIVPEPVAPAKRKRGRPRKHPLPEAAVPAEAVRA